MQMQNNDNNAYLQLLLRSKQSFWNTPRTHGVWLVQRCCGSFGNLILATAYVLFLYVAFRGQIIFDIQENFPSVLKVIPTNHWFSAAVRNRITIWVIYVHSAAVSSTSFLFISTPCPCLIWHLNIFTFGLGASWLQASSLHSENVFAPRLQAGDGFASDRWARQHVCVCVWNNRSHKMWAVHLWTELPDYPLTSAPTSDRASYDWTELPWKHVKYFVQHTGLGLMTLICLKKNCIPDKFRRQSNC